MPNVHYQRMSMRGKSTGAKRKNKFLRTATNCRWLIMNEDSCRTGRIMEDHCCRVHKNKKINNVHKRISILLKGLQKITLI